MVEYTRENNWSSAENAPCHIGGIMVSASSAEDHRFESRSSKTTKYYDISICCFSTKPIRVCEVSGFVTNL
jgi:hypothetical protein